MQIISDRYGRECPKRLVINRVGVQIIRKIASWEVAWVTWIKRPALACPAPGSPSPTLFSGMPTLEPSGWLDP